jgi:ABC-type antimicrobial peptide transport system permease subunit
VGRTFEFSGKPQTVVGVIADIREHALTDPADQQVYLPIETGMPINIAVVARGIVTGPRLLAALSAAIREVDPAQAIFHLRMMDDVVNASVAPRRTNTLLIAIFAALALILSSLGVYAVVSHGVAQRRREFGIRSALGASTQNLLGLVSREMAWMAGIGIVTGLAGAWALARLTASLLYGVTVHDPVTFIVVPLVLLVPATLATVIPARRAARVNLAEVMRAE